MSNRSPADETMYWEKVYREAPMVAISRCEDAAKQLISLVSFLITTYIGIVSFSNVLQQPMLLRPKLLFILFPLPFLLTSLIFATRVIVPRTYVIRQIQNDYEKISQVKYGFLRWSYVHLIVSMLTLIAVIAIYVLFVPPPPV